VFVTEVTGYSLVSGGDSGGVFHWMRFTFELDVFSTITSRDFEDVTGAVAAVHSDSRLG
jgi:hypothetical protein